MAKEWQWCRLAPSPHQAVLSRIMRNQRASSSRRAARRDDDAIPKNRVVSIDRPEQPDSPKPRLIAQDTATHRLIIGIGQQRLAFDMTTRITQLTPGTGDAPAPVLPVKKGPRGKKNREQG